MSRILLILTLFSISIFPLLSQDTLFVMNKGFECDIKDTRNFQDLKYWHDCHFFARRSPPDINFKYSSHWNNTIDPIEGNSYVSMVIRDDGTYEGIYQNLVTPLKKGETYKFSIMLCTSPLYESPINSDIRNVYSFNGPIVLEVFGQDEKTEEYIFLDTTGEIKNHIWKEYTLSFKPNQDYDILLLRAYYTDESHPVNCNLLMDDMSDIYRIPAQ